MAYRCGDLAASVSSAWLRSWISSLPGLVGHDLPHHLGRPYLYRWQTTLANLLTIADLDYVVNTRQDRELYVATAYGEGETWITRAPGPYAAAVELAGQVGIELEDG